MRPIQLGNPPESGTVEQKLDWCIRALKAIEVASRDDTNEVFDAFTPSNVTTTRAFDADSTTVAEVADVLGTLMTDIKERLA